MILRKILTIIFVSITTFLFSQNGVCDNETSDNLIDVNTINKCHIERFKNSKDKEYISIATRNRYIRKTTNPYLTNLKKLKKATTAIAVSSKSQVVDVDFNKKPELVKNYIRFDKVNEIPVFVTCADFSKELQENCKKETLVHYVLDNLIYPFDAAAEGIEGRVWVRFIIDKEGYVKSVNSKGPSDGVLLEKEAERLISLLPKFIPGKHNDKNVNVEYFIPIDFQLDE